MTRTIVVVVVGLALVAVLSSCSSGCVALFAPRAKVVDNPIVDDLRHQPAHPSRFDHSTFDALLATYVDPTSGRVDYAGLKGERKKLDAYLDHIAHADLRALDRNEKLALLINAYNAYTLALILDHYPKIHSIKDLDSPWTARTHVVGGHKLSLDDIEHGLLRPLYRDSRIHFAVNCASKGCPPLAPHAYTGAHIDAQLDQAVRRTLQNPRYARVHDDHLDLTSLLNWYRKDFTSADFSPHARTIPMYVARYARPDVVHFIEKHSGEPAVTFVDYDWSLNDVDR